ncbi:MAG: hypothetical protein P1S60_17275 [Anaerolineae bacterium]|nr:hypothetical protein [Anaerolineae bacterium]
MTQKPSTFEPATSQPTLHDIAAVWWPLAISWLLMSVEGPAHSAIVSRLAEPEIHLAAWGGIVFPISLLMESPIVMLLSASTALSTDWDAYKKLRRFMLVLGAILSLIHISIAFTPLYDIVTRRIIGAPEAIIEPGRLGLMIMTPWAWSIGYRRIQQGIMIRFGHSRAVGTGTLIRLLANAVVLTAGYLVKTIPGIVVASGAVTAGVVAEATFAGLRARPIIRQYLLPAPHHEPAITLSSLLKFYIPLAITTMVSFFVSPLGSAAMSRMPNPLASLAVWPVLYGLIFILRSPCMAVNETVIAVINKPGALKNLRIFIRVLAWAVVGLTLLISATPLADIWLEGLMALPADLLSLARNSLWLALLLPFFALLMNWYQGLIVSSQQTRGVTEAVFLYIAVIACVLFIGIKMHRVTGLYVALVAYEIAGLVQGLWLWWRSRPAVSHHLSTGINRADFSVY